MMVKGLDLSHYTNVDEESEKEWSKGKERGPLILALTFPVV